MADKLKIVSSRNSISVYFFQLLYVVHDVVVVFVKYWQTTGAELFIFPQCCPRSTERVMQVMGKLINVSNTVGTVLDLIAPVRHIQILLCSAVLRLYE